VTTNWTPATSFQDFVAFHAGFSDSVFIDQNNGRLPAIISNIKPGASPNIQGAFVLR